MPRRKMEDIPKTGVLAERTLPDGRRKIKLRSKERRDLLRRQRAEHAAALFLDLDNAYTWAQIAEILEISPVALRELTKSEEFDEAYNNLFAELGHDPRYQAAIGALSDMLPTAIRELQNLLIGQRTPPTVKLRAAFKIIELNGITPHETALSDRQELADYLRENKIISLNFPLPEQFNEAMEQLGVVEGEYSEAGGSEVVALEDEPPEQEAPQNEK